VFVGRFLFTETGESIEYDGDEQQNGCNDKTHPQGIPFDKVVWVDSQSGLTPLFAIASRFSSRVLESAGSSS